MQNHLKLFGVMFLLVIILPALLFAQGRRGGVISGKVIDADEDVPIEYANIILLKNSDSSQVTGTVSDKKGIFQLNRIPPGEYHMKVRFMGYEEKVIENLAVNRNNRKINVGAVELRQKQIMMDEAVVEGERAPISYEIDKKVINVDQQFSDISGNAVDILENVPAVTVDIEGNVSLRGSGNFTVLIDGRPSVLDANEALQQIPASTIKNIEIITNPSAKYDPEGTAGIINIILKKNSNEGFSGMADLNGGLRDKYGGELLFNYKNSFYKATLGFDYNNRFYPYQSEELSRTTHQGNTSVISSNGNTNRGRVSMGMRGSIDFEISENDALTIGGRYGDRSSQRNSSQAFRRWMAESPEDINFYTNDAESERSGYYYDVYANYQHNFKRKGHKLTVEFEHDYHTGDDITQNELINNNTIQNGQRSREFGPSRDFELDIEYVLPFGEDRKFEAGYQNEFEDEEENNEVFHYQSGQGYVFQEKFSNYTKGTEREHAFYSMYSGKLGDFGYQLGMRTEYTYRKIELLERDQDFEIDRWDYFPSIHSSYKFPNDHQIMASYTRRIDRPRGWYLEPFITWSDAYSVRQGNPGLVPEFINSYELGYQKYLGKSLFSVEAYYRVTNNKIERIRSVYQEDVTLTTFYNVGNDYSLGTELMFNFDPIENWNVNLMGNLYNYRVKGEFEDQSFDRESFSWSSRLNNTVKIGDMTRLQANLRYNSPRVYSQGEREGYFTTSLAVKRDFLNKMLSVTLQVRDVFGTAQYEYTSSGTDFYTYNFFDRESPMVMLNLRFNINNYESERNGRRGGGGMDEPTEF
jgi:outer membrane receptor protein involved in Fe transport